MSDAGQRHTVVGVVEIVDQDALAEREAANALAQFDAILDLIDEATRGQRRFRLRVSTILQLHRIAMAGIHPLAGTFRNSPVGIEGSKHQPPREHLVAVFVEDMCDWLDSNWETASPLSLCAYTMWRLNWIHPFADGNGRTSRAVAYLVLCARVGYNLPGSKTIPEQIAEDRPPYYHALEVLDERAADGGTDLSVMVELLATCLQQQLDSAYLAATTVLSDATSRRFH